MSRQYLLNLIVVREQFDDSTRAELNLDRINVSYQGKRYPLNKASSTTIPLDSWSDVSKVIVLDELHDKNSPDYHKLSWALLKSQIKNDIKNPNKTIRTYLLKLPPQLGQQSVSMRIDFYAMVYENQARQILTLIPMVGIEYQIDRTLPNSKASPKKIVGKTSTVKQLVFNHGYTKEIELIPKASYRIYFIEKNKPFNPPDLKIPRKQKALILKVEDTSSLSNPYIHEYQFQTFLQFQVVRKNKEPLSKTSKIQIQLLDYAEKVIKTVKVDNKTGKTGKFIANYKRKIKVLVDGKPIAPIKIDLKDSNDNVTPSVFDFLRVVTIPLIDAITIPKVANKKPAEALMLAKGKLPIIYDLENQELIILTHKNYKKLIEKLSDADKKLAEVHKNRYKIAKALEDNDINAVQKAEKVLAAAETEAKSSINQSFSKMDDLKEIFLVENSVTRDKADKATLTRHYTNKKDFVSVVKNALNPKEADKKITIKSLGGVELSLKPDSLDIEALKKSIEKIKLSISKDFDLVEGSKDLNVLDFLLPSANELSKTILQSKRFQVDTEAQWLRMAGSVSGSMSGEFSPETRDVGLDGGFDIEGKLILCEGSITPMMALPSLKGFAMRLKFTDGIELDAGAVRFLLSCEINGFTGAKFSIAGSANATIDKDGRQKIVAVARDPKQSVSSMWNSAKKLPEFEMEEGDAKEKASDESNLGASIGVEVFAGVEASATPKGSIEWISPETNEFEAFAEVALTGGLSAGAGGTLDLYVYYREGKFRVRVKAALCIEVGAKGGVEFEVNVALIAEFIRWVFYQLINVGFKVLFYFAPYAFRYLTQLSVLHLGQGAPLTQSISNISTKLKTFGDNLEVGEARYKLAKRIVSHADDDMLLCSTPEAKGILLYELSRHSKHSHMLDFPTTDIEEFDVQVHYLSTHKKAILAIFNTVTTLREWDNVLQHMTQEGSKGVRAENEAHIIRLLNHGKSLASDATINTILASIPLNKISKDNDTGNRYLDLYLDMLAGSIKSYYPKGKKVVRHSDYDHTINEILSRNNYVSPNFYAANNLQHYDKTVSLEHHTSDSTDRSSDDGYQV